MAASDGWVMGISFGAKALLCAVALLALAACGAKGPPVTLGPPSALTAPEKTRLLVVETVSANFGANQRLFESRFHALAESCRVTVDFFVPPPVGGQLTLDPTPGTAQADFNRHAQSFQPDGILEFQITGWSGMGGLQSDPSAPLVSGSYGFSLRLLEGKKRTEQWRTTGSVSAASDSGGALLAQEIVRAFAHNGAFPRCPPAILQF